jgi:hypothetical protein
MRGNILTIHTLLLVFVNRLVHAGPFSFPLSNGFPFPDNDALEELFTRAGGNFTNMPLAPKFDDDSLTSWKLQAFNEFMEVAFFTQLIANITERVSGYELDPETESYVLNSLKTIQAVSPSLSCPYSTPSIMPQGGPGPGRVGPPSHMEW